MSNSRHSALNWRLYSSSLLILSSSPPHTPPPQVSVPVVLQRRPDAIGELGLQHGGPSAPCPPPGQHHPARQRAGSAVDRQAAPSSQQQGAPPVCTPPLPPPKKNPPTLDKLGFSSTDSTASGLQSRRDREREILLLCFPLSVHLSVSSALKTRWVCCSASQLS